MLLSSVPSKAYLSVCSVTFSFLKARGKGIDWGMAEEYNQVRPHSISLRDKYETGSSGNHHYHNRYYHAHYNSASFPSKKRYWQTEQGVRNGNVALASRRKDQQHTPQSPKGWHSCHWHWYNSNFYWSRPVQMGLAELYLVIHYCSYGLCLYFSVPEKITQAINHQRKWNALRDKG